MLLQDSGLYHCTYLERLRHLTGGGMSVSFALCFFLYSSPLWWEFLEWVIISTTGKMSLLVVSLVCSSVPFSPSWFLLELGLWYQNKAYIVNTSISMIHMLSIPPRTVKMFLYHPSHLYHHRIYLIISKFIHVYVVLNRICSCCLLLFAILPSA